MEKHLVRQFSIFPLIITFSNIDIASLMKNTAVTFVPTETEKKTELGLL